MESTFTARVSIEEVENGFFNAVISRITDEKLITLSRVSGLTPADIHTLFGFHVERKVLPPEEASLQMKRLLDNTLSDTRGRTIFTSKEVEDLLLDLRNLIPESDDVV